MTEDELGRLFRPFEQPHHLEGQARQGLGLGLTIVKGLVEGHGGVIQVCSEGRDRGTVVEITLRATSAADAPVTVQGTRRSTLPPAACPTVLFVEDHPDTAILFEHLLRKSGYRVLTAKSCAQARERMSAEIDLIVSDVGLPDGTGLDLLPALRATRDVPAVAVTGYGTEGDVEATRRAGFQCHLTKPTGMQALQKAIAQARRAWAACWALRS
jgi:CheY-like chemotaxis protein